MTYMLLSSLHKWLVINDHKDSVPFAYKTTANNIVCARTYYAQAYFIHANITNYTHDRIAYKHIENKIPSSQLCKYSLVYISSSEELNFRNSVVTTFSYSIFAMSPLAWILIVVAVCGKWLNKWLNLIFIRGFTHAKKL